MEIMEPRDFNQGLAAIAGDSRLQQLWEEILSAIADISEAEIIDYFQSQKRSAKSISEAINMILDKKLVKKNGTGKVQFIRMKI